VVSAVSFAVGAALPLGLIVLAPWGQHPGDRAGRLGAARSAWDRGARLGGAPAGRAALRVTVGGGLAMALSVLIGQLVGTTGR
jgi:hypothetical protein